MDREIGLEEAADLVDRWLWDHDEARIRASFMGGELQKAVSILVDHAKGF